VACGNAVLFEQFSASEHAKVTLKAPPPCVDRNPLNNGYFSVLCLHTVRSNNAFSFGARGTPYDVYRYAFGKGGMSLSGDLGNERNKRGAHINRALAFTTVVGKPDANACYDGPFADYQNSVSHAA
jgi:hypothetical protein